MGKETNKRPTCRICCFSIFAILGLAMVIIGSSILGVVFPKIMDKKISENTIVEAKFEQETCEQGQISRFRVQLTELRNLSLQIHYKGLRIESSNDTETYKRFVKSPVPGYMTFYLFTVVNKEEVNENGSTPVLKEVGPYVFRQEKEKENLRFDSSNGTVFYQERTRYFYEEEMSKGDLSATINHVNMLSMGLLENPTLQAFVPVMGHNLEKVMSETGKPYIDSHTADELLFGGYRTEDYFPLSLGTLCSAAKMCETGFYFGKNDTLSQEYQVSTGADDIQTIGEIITYDKSSELHFWQPDSHCNHINGTDGKQFPPGIDKDRGYYVFSADICRSLKFEYVEETVIEKIDVYRFAVPEKVFADPNIDKDNMCYCYQKPKVMEPPCPSKAGVIPLKNCQEGKDIAASSPHFLYGEPEYINNFEGLKPDKRKHQTFIDIEPLTGTSLSAAKRIQINWLVQPRENVSFLEHVKEAFYFPMFWAEEGAKIDPKSAEEFRDKVSNPYKTGKWSLVAVIAIGGVMFLLVIVVALFKGCS